MISDLVDTVGFQGGHDATRISNPLSISKQVILQAKG
jgi:hypothetical protein